jgi:hypothetical protein
MLSMWLVTIVFGAADSSSLAAKDPAQDLRGKEKKQEGLILKTYFIATLNIMDGNCCFSPGGFCCCCCIPLHTVLLSTSWQIFFRVSVAHAAVI